MANKKLKSITPGSRQRQIMVYDTVTEAQPEKSLLKKLNKFSGRNNTGRITVRHQGGGVKRKYRVIDFKRDKNGIPATVKTIEYDPNRNANICLVVYADGEKRYILAPQKIKVGDKIENGPKSDIRVGNHLPLKNIPVSSIIHNVELSIGAGGQLARSAGNYATITGRSGKYINVKLPSGEVRLIHQDCRATLGQVSNPEYRNTKIGKAGAKRWKGVRPTVRGSVMNPCDHPHGGGEGRAPIGRPGPLSPWGKPTLGYKTRNRKKQSTKYIIKKRK